MGVINKGVTTLLLGTFHPRQEENKLKYTGRASYLEASLGLVMGWEAQVLELK